MRDLAIIAVISSASASNCDTGSGLRIFASISISYEFRLVTALACVISTVRRPQGRAKRSGVEPFGSAQGEENLHAERRRGTPLEGHFVAVRSPYGTPDGGNDKSAQFNRVWYNW